MSEAGVDPDATTEDGPEEPEAPPAPLLTLRDGLSAVVDTPAQLAATCEAVAGGTGPVAIDAERASGYRYSNRAYLIQLRREGAGTHLVDPIAFDEEDEPTEAMETAAARSHSVAVTSVRVGPAPTPQAMRDELLSIRRLLSP